MNIGQRVWHACAYLVRVEIWIEDNNSICGPQIDTDTASAGTQDVDEDVGIRFIKLVHVLLPIRLLGVSVLGYMLSTVLIPIIIQRTYQP